jgi:hypothetical protein
MAISTLLRLDWSDFPELPANSLLLKLIFGFWAEFWNFTIQSRKMLYFSLLAGFFLPRHSRACPKNLVIGF